MMCAQRRCWQACYAQIDFAANNWQTHKWQRRQIIYIDFFVRIFPSQILNDDCLQELPWDSSHTTSFLDYAALKEYMVVTELSPAFIFYFFLQVTVEYWNLHPVRTTISDYTSQWELIAITKSREWWTYLLGNSDRLRSLYLQHCAAHASVNFIFVCFVYLPGSALYLQHLGVRREL